MAIFGILGFWFCSHGGGRTCLRCRDRIQRKAGGEGRGPLFGRSKLGPDWSCRACGKANRPWVPRCVFCDTDRPEARPPPPPLPQVLPTKGAR